MRINFIPRLAPARDVSVTVRQILRSTSLGSAQQINQAHIDSPHNDQAQNDSPPLSGLLDLLLTSLAHPTGSNIQPLGPTPNQAMFTFSTTRSPPQPRTRDGPFQFLPLSLKLAAILAEHQRHDIDSIMHGNMSTIGSWGRTMSTCGKSCQGGSKATFNKRHPSMEANKNPSQLIAVKVGDLFVDQGPSS